jgi:hypothetical protein
MVACGTYLPLEALIVRVQRVARQLQLLPLLRRLDDKVRLALGLLLSVHALLFIRHHRKLALQPVHSQAAALQFPRDPVQVLLGQLQLCF